MPGTSYPGTLHINYGRVGTSGQSSVKELGAAAAAALAKQADGKRRKGYVDSGAAAPAAAAPAEAEAEPVVPAGPRTIELVRGGERRVAVRLTSDGAEVRTEVTETYGSPAEAAAAFARIVEAMTAEGYQGKP